MDRRLFIGGLSATTGLALTQPALAQSASAPAIAPAIASATRLDTQRVRLNWPARSGPASIFMATDPTQFGPLMRPVQTGVRGGQVIVQAPTSPRPYFLVSTGFGRQVRVAERLLPLEGGRNFRDLGGYRGAGGKDVKWGRIYRSGVMANLTRADVAYLSSLGISIICDLRSPQERTNEPSALLGNPNIKIMSHDYELTSSLSRLAATTTREQAVEAFAGAYMNFMDTLAPQYTDLFASLLDSQAPVALNCSAGKDRTGVGSALILAVLGVDRRSIVADYALSQTYVPVSYYLNLGRTPAAGQPATAAQVSPYARLPEAARNVILGSDPDVMVATLKSIDAQFGSPVELVKRKFGVSDAGVRELRNRYLV
jgi:protein-tyrosine phosphatase